MIKENKRKLIISSVIILLPAVFGLIFWNRLPEVMTTHWGLDGTANGWNGRGAAVLTPPLVLLAAHWFCFFVTAKDPKNNGQNRKVMDLIFWIMPAVSLFVNAIMYMAAFDKEIHLLFIGNVIMGVLFIAIGNYMPKCKQNYTIGVKIKWTLENEENWNATHRFTGKVWVIGGLLLIACAMLPEAAGVWVMVGSILVLTALPLIYSYAYHKKQVKQGTADAAPLPKACTKKSVKTVSVIITAAVLIFVGIMMFTGDIDVRCGETAFTVEASFWQDLTVEYDAIESIEYRENDSKGVRTFGLGSGRLLAGAFRNNEFGNYTRYSYTRCDACVVLKADGKILVLSGPDAESTMDIFKTIETRTAQN